MPPRPFYKIEKQNQLFDEKRNNPTANRKVPEEDIRQWVLFELLSTYGYSIINIDIEVDAGQLRSKEKCWADIVIYRERQPYIVVECKKQQLASKIEKGLKQAQDYAGNLGAEFIVFADRSNWIVRRNWGKEWINVVDIERCVHNENGHNSPKKINIVDEMAPLFYWLHKPVPANLARDYFSAVHMVFSTILLLDLDYDLISGIVCLLVILGKFAKSNDTTFEITEYNTGKIKEAHLHFQRFFEKTSIKASKELTSVYDFDAVLRDLISDFYDLLHPHKDMKKIEVSFLRLTYFLLRYLKDVQTFLKFSAIPYKSIVEEIEKILDYILITNLNVALPDAVDEDDLIVFFALGEAAWESFISRNK